MKRRSTLKISLALIGAVAITASCSRQESRHIYKNKEDCLADWGNTSTNCEEIKNTDSRYHSGGRFFGPYFHSGSSYPGSGSRAIGTHSTSRSGFGSSGRSYSSSGG